MFYKTCSIIKSIAKTNKTLNMTMIGSTTCLIYQRY